MIFTLYVAVDLALAFFTLAVGAYAAIKAYRVSEGGKAVASDQRYELEKDYYLVSTVGWLTLATRILAIPLFYATAISLIPFVPGAMCEFGVLQAGSPFSWAGLGLKMVTLFVFGGWLFFDFLNKRLKTPAFMTRLASGFVLLVPLFFVDALLDIAFFGTLKPLVVPCCMVVYSIYSGVGCPFCLVTYEMPLLIGVIAGYAVALALMIWSVLAKRSAHKLNVQHEVEPTLSKALKASVVLAVLGTVLLMIQILIGPL